MQLQTDIGPIDLHLSRARIASLLEDQLAAFRPLGQALTRQFHFEWERALYQLGPATVNLLARLMLDMDILWQAPLPPGPKILAANHPTTVDPFLLLTLAPDDMRILVTSGAFTVPLFGRYLGRVGHIPVARGNGKAALAEAQWQLASGRTIGIFPEGTLSPACGDLGQPRTGVARLALKAGVPVVPVGIALQPERVKFVAAKIDGDPAVGRFYLDGPYAMTIGRPLLYQGDVADWDAVRTITADIMERIGHLSRQSASRIKIPQGRPSPQFQAADLAGSDL